MTGAAPPSSKRRAPGPAESGEFPKTRWSLIRAASGDRSPDAIASLEHLSGLYWQPVYSYFRRRWGTQDSDAQDLTQEFFASVCRGAFLSRPRPELGRFRSYVKGSLDNFARLKHRHGKRLKRGGGVRTSSIHGNDVADRRGRRPDEEFDADWARILLEGGLEELRAEYRKSGQKKALEIFLLRDVSPPEEGPPDYAELAKKFGVKVTDVTNILFRARKRLRELVMKRVCETVSTREDAQREILELFGRKER